MLPLLLTTFAYTVDAVVESLFQPITPGDNICVAAPLVITSAITPEPGVGSVVSPRLASFDLLVESVYNVTHAAAEVCTFRSE